MSDARHMPDTAPHTNIDLERQVLGQMIECSGAWDLFVGAGVRETDFFKLAHRLIYRAIASVVATGVKPDIVTVGLELRRTGTLEEVNAAYFSGLTAGMVRPSAEAAQFIAAEFAELAGKRAVADALEKGDLSEIASRVEAAQTRGTDQRRVYDAEGQLGAVRSDAERDQLGRLWLGFPTLDNIIGGLRAGEVFGLMARPGIGKTLTLGHITQYASETEFGHVFFSLEMAAAPIVDRLAGAYFGLDRHAFRERLAASALDEADYIRAFRRFVLVDAPGLDVAGMTAKLRQIQAGPLRGVPIRLVTVDHLGLIGGDRKMSTYDRVSTQARELKELAKRFNVSVVLAVQVNREAGGDGSKELHLGSARDSGVVEEAMDYLVAMRRLDRSQTLAPYEREKYRDVLFAKVVKNRHGAPDTEIAIRIDPGTLRLREDPDLRITANELERIAAQAGGRRR
jgi:replicative DNA helicase